MRTTTSPTVTTPERPTDDGARRILIADHTGHTTVAYNVLDTTAEGQAAVAAAAALLAEPRAAGCLGSRTEGVGAGAHVIDRRPFDPAVEEYAIVAPLVGG